MAKKILFAWLGMTDLRCAEQGNAEELGPIGRVASESCFAQVVLLNNYGKEADAEGYAAWLKRLCGVPIDLVAASLPSPTDFSAIYVAARKGVENVLKDTGGRLTPVFHLSPGTPAMAAVWIMLAKGRFPEAQLVQSSRQMGVEWVEMPFDITAEFVPDAKLGADRRLVVLSEAVPPENSEFKSIVHRCPAMKRLIAQAQMVAVRDVPVLIEGETGTGKELFARAIHKGSSRSEGDFVPVNCGAIPRELFEAEFFGYKRGAFTGADRDHGGYFEQAHGGTLFLDELGELPVEAQVKILRVLNDGKVRRIGESKERSVDVRIISATNRYLLEEVSKGRFRADLFYRLAVAVLKLPPLREREGDLGPLVDALLREVNEKLGETPGYEYKKFSINAKNILIGHAWPGNIRELRNTILRVCVWCPDATIQEVDVRQSLLPILTEANDDILSRPLGDGFNISELQGFVAKHYIKRALDQAGGNKSRAADLLGFANYQTLSNWMKRHGLNG